VVNIDPNNIQPCVGNPGIFDENHLVLGISNCEADKEVCLDIEPDVVPDFDFEVDGAAYQGSFEVCEFERFVSYSYFLLPGNGAQGPYYLDGWQTGNKLFKGGFENIAALVDSMNLWNPAGNWQLNAVTKMIKSGGAVDSYGAMRIVQTQTAVATSLEPNLGSRATSVSLGLGA